MWLAVAAAVISLAAALVAITWSTLQAKQRGRRFEKLIRRELEEVGPHPTSPRSESADKLQPWWEYATKRFIHEEMFQRNSVAANHAFLLSLNPTVVYQVSQLWIALEKRDGINWLHFMKEASRNPRLSSAKLDLAVSRWEKILAGQRPEWQTAIGIPTPYRQESALNRAAELFKARLVAYGRLLVHLDDRRISAAGCEPQDIAKAMTAWYYEDGNGLLLSGRALEQFTRTRDVLQAASRTRAEVENSMSLLRTDLKIDLGTRQPQERSVALAWPEDERW